VTQPLDPELRRVLLEKLRGFYERELTEGQGAYFGVGDSGDLVPTRMGRHWLAEHLRLFTGLLGLAENDRFLDVGCGEGYYTVALARAARLTTAADMSSSVLRLMGRLRDFDPDRVQRVVTDVERLPFAAEGFDKALCSHMLEHVLDDRAVVGEIRRVMKPGGVAVFAIPLKYTAQYGALRALEGAARALLKPGKKAYPVSAPGELDVRLVGAQAHIRHYSAPVFRRMLEESGFQVTDVKGVWFHDPRNWLVRFTQPHRLTYALGSRLSKRWPSLGAGLVVRTIRP
jgi:ubiquinone/menaquinone biosynthesis C-methylase UbiE